MKSLTHKIRNPSALLCFTAVFCASFWHAAFAFSQEQFSEDQIQIWIARLADADPDLRKEAEIELLAAGEKALTATRAGSNSSDLEISSRCRILVEKIEKERRTRVSKIFLADEATQDDLIAFPAWAAFRDFNNSEDIETRKLFLRMCKELSSVFVDYKISGEKDAASLKKKARLLLVPGDSYKGSTVAQTIGFLFLSDLAVKSLQGKQPKELFSMVETLEALRFISNYSNSSMIRDSEFRNLIELRIAEWVSYWESEGRISEEAKLNMIYQTSNLNLIQTLEASYESLSVEQRIRFIDIAYRASSNKKKESWIACRNWLKKPLDDETTAVQSRVRKEPAAKVVVTIKMLAEGVLAKAIKRSAGMGEPVKTEPIFGSFPFSKSAFVIIRKEQERKTLSEYLRNSRPSR